MSWPKQGPVVRMDSLWKAGPSLLLSVYGKYNDTSKISFMISSDVFNGRFSSLWAAPACLKQARLAIAKVCRGWESW